MSHVFPVVRGRMGSTTYYQANVPVRDLVAVAKTASEMTEWTNWSLVERFQREIAMKRIREEIVPYLVRSCDRFFGSLIVLIFRPATLEFESLNGHVKTAAAYQSAAQRLGFLTVDGGDFVTLDGQHRLVALREVVRGDSQGGGAFTSAVAEDDLSVIFIPFESLEKTRRIFNKVNRYARPTSPTDNIITSEDDGCAIVARWLVENEPPLGLTAPQPPLALYDGDGQPLVAWRSIKLSPSSLELTTLHVVYQTVQAILDANGLPHFDERHRINRPTNAELERAYRHAAHWWQAVLAGLDPVRRALRRPSDIPNYRRYRHGSSLLFRPVAQIALFRGLERAVSLGVPLNDAIATANSIKWRASHRQWLDTIIRSNGRMIATQSAISLTGRLIAYMIAGNRLSAADRLKLARDYATARGYDPASPNVEDSLPRMVN